MQRKELFIGQRKDKMFPSIEISTRPTRWDIPKEDEDNRTVIVVFSRNRPLQLDLCLNSLLYCCLDPENIGQLFVIYKNDKEYTYAFNTLINEHPEATFIAETDFKQNVLDCLKNRQFVVFVTDDTIFCNPFSVQDIAKKLDEYNRVLGFSLRLSCHTSYCYPLNKSQNIPMMDDVGNGIMMYFWPITELDFFYPLELSSSVYRTEDILKIIEDKDFSNPNSLEALMYVQIGAFINSKYCMMCYKKSAAFAAPNNRVQNVAPDNRFGNREEYDPERLLIIYENGIRVDHKKFYGMIPKSVHVEANYF